MSRRSRQTVIGSSIGAILASSSLVLINLVGAPGEVVGESEKAVGEAEMPSALAAHIEALHRAAPGPVTEADRDKEEEGPGSSADAEFEKRAYPGQTISVAEEDAAKAAFQASAARALPAGLEPNGAWSEAGPSRALYPFTQFRDAFSYVPNEYVAGGRTTSMAINQVCEPLDCRAYITAAGGGVWASEDVLATEPRWSYLGGPLGINAAGSVTIDSNDPTGQTIYVGTGEANICASGCVAGVGLYKSTDGGSSWVGPMGKDELGGKGLGEIIVPPGQPQTIYVATTSALRGMSSVCCGGVTRPVPDAAKWGLYKSTDGGATWDFIHNGSDDATECTGDQTEFLNESACSPRGVRDIELDPSDSDTIYASSYARGIWRSRDAGATWTLIKPSLNPDLIQTRAAFDVTELPNGDTRMYVHEGNIGTPHSRLFRSDDVATGSPSFTTLTSADVTRPGFATYNQCGGQCWYDLFVTSPDGYPDVVYTGGSYSYDEPIANKRAVILSTDAGVTGTDMTFDGTDITHPNGLHPDEHDLVTNPSNPYQFFETGDGGVVRSSGTFVNRSVWCEDPRRDLNADELARCKQMLSRIPSKLTGINTGLSTLQFVSLSVSPNDANMLQGGTQDNGTWENKGETTTWVNTMIGDGGQSGFDVDVPEFRFHNFTGTSTDVNFNSGEIGDWIWTADPLQADAGTMFYAPVISDPVTSGTMFAGTGQTAYRTTTFGLGDRTIEEANAICNEWTGTFSETCGDWARLGPTPLVDPAWGDREGGGMVAIERTVANKRTAWAATSTGRVFRTGSANAANPADTVWTRLDDDTALGPNRFVTSIYVHPNRPNRAWISYSGFNSKTPDTPGHVFKVRYFPDLGTSTWKNLSRHFGDLPVNDLVRDDRHRDLYAATDFGVVMKPAGSRLWVAAAAGMPNVEVSGLTVAPGKPILYAASHGLGAWKLSLRE
jgi:hypothetical protein